MLETVLSFFFTLFPNNRVRSLPSYLHHRSDEINIHIHKSVKYRRRKRESSEHKINQILHKNVERRHISARIMIYYWKIKCRSLILVEYKSHVSKQ